MPLNKDDPRFDVVLDSRDPDFAAKLAAETDGERVYVAIAQIGECRICRERHDLRCGVCFDCASHVAGEKVSAVTHRLWDSRNPANVWFYSEDGN